MIKWIRRQKLKTQMLFVIITAAVLSLFIFILLWHLQPFFWNLFSKFPGVALEQDAFIQELKDAARNYVLPESIEVSEESFKQLEGFLVLADEYTALSIYDEETGHYIYGKSAEVMNYLIIGSIMDSGYRLTRGKGEVFFQTTVDFKNKRARLNIISYHPTRIIYPYFFMTLALSIFFFLFCILHFVKRKMNGILRINDDVLLMASGNLSHPVTDCGEDEIGILSHGLDQLRQALDAHIRQEAASRKANQDLITAMSHDLRTPLTILNGYLEVIQLKKAPPAMQEEFLTRCLQKTNEIKDMTDKMFEYALIYEDIENIDLAPVPAVFLEQCLSENTDFIQLAGFTADLSLSGVDAAVNGDETTLKRIFNNLFSNILKYGLKSSPVRVTSEVTEQTLIITLSNSVRQDTADIESNQIGLKSVEKMALLQHGTLYTLQSDGTFCVTLTFPLLPAL